MADPIRLRITDEGPYGFAVESPDLPGFYFGRPTMAEVEADLGDALRFHDATLSGRPLRAQQFRRIEMGGQEVVIRLSLDDARNRRAQASKILKDVLAGPDGPKLLGGVRDTDGVLHFICVVDEERLGAVLRDMDERGETAHLVVAVSPNAIFTAPMEVGPGPREGSIPIAELGLTEDSTIAETRAAIVAFHSNDRVLVPA